MLILPSGATRTPAPLPSNAQLVDFDDVHDLFTLWSANDDPLVIHASLKFWSPDRAEDD